MTSVRLTLALGGVPLGLVMFLAPDVILLAVGVTIVWVFDWYRHC